ncbi:uncharacterized protein EI97DRAFT_502113 [Westerdykella ornata]|uniref:F-box domain-containing protein n=1 Tax=Westerdykella ornata TaxID=318751 RepID=A0A6A6JGR6_WESOR|nr:uncharacterized protein EI97DRAFT_502113 [Westerdykella ornata]KAF2275168.1 hypothetical protein EI97DRAFT_502113 [Westerdykella ornata]
MLFQDLATELVLHIFYSVSEVTDVLALASTCHRFHNIYSSSQKLAILENVAETQYGPLRDLTQLLTHNASQPAHLIRNVPFSVAILKQIVHAGRVASKWCYIYPFKKWKDNYENRRLLTPEERYRVRRAIYRIWLYSRAFHNADHPRGQRTILPVVQKRSALLHNWSTDELAEIADVHAVMRDVVQNNICPSNGTIIRKFKKRYPDSNEHHLLFNLHLNYPSLAPPLSSNSPFFAPYHTTCSPLQTHFTTTQTYTDRYASSKFSMRAQYNVGAEGWGDDIVHYYVVEDMLKLDPEQIMWLKEHAPFKGMVEAYVRELGEWFENNGETWGQTLQWVLDERGEDVEEFMEKVAEGEWGCAVRGEY